MLGAIELFGRKANLRKLSDEQWRLAGAVGFAVAAGGAATIGAFRRAAASADALQDSQRGDARHDHAAEADGQGRFHVVHR